MKKKTLEFLWKGFNFFWQECYSTESHYEAFYRFLLFDRSIRAKIIRSPRKFQWRLRNDENVGFLGVPSCTLDNYSRKALSNNASRNLWTILSRNQLKITHAWSNAWNKFGTRKDNRCTWELVPAATVRELIKTLERRERPGPGAGPVMIESKRGIITECDRQIRRAWGGWVHRGIQSLSIATSCELSRTLLPVAVRAPISSGKSHFATNRPRLAR